jgi:hypothetical protein
MTTRHWHSDRMSNAVPTIRVDRNRHGSWEVAVPGQNRNLTCATLDDARRVAYLQASRQRPCQLVICDAYHRVARRELI